MLLQQQLLGNYSRQIPEIGVNMFGKRKDIVLSESTLVILESANAILEYITCGSAKRFHFVTLKFHDHEDRVSQMVTVHGLAKTEVCDRSFEASIILMIDKSNEGFWRFSPMCTPMLEHNNLKITLSVSDNGGFTYYSSVDKKFHDELKSRWGFNN